MEKGRKRLLGVMLASLIVVVISWIYTNVTIKDQNCINMCSVSYISYTSISLLNSFNNDDIWQLVIKIIFILN